MSDKNVGSVFTTAGFCVIVNNSSEDSAVRKGQKMVMKKIVLASAIPLKETGAAGSDWACSGNYSQHSRRSGFRYRSGKGGNELIPSKGR